MTGLGKIRSVDRARSIRLVLAVMEDDSDMFSAALEETLQDDYGHRQLGSLINVLRVMSISLTEAMDDRYGRDQAMETLRQMLLEQAGDPS